MRILPYLAGYVQIEVQGAFPEKWINIAIRRGLRVWDLERRDDRCFRLRMPLKQYRRHTRSICKKSGCRTHVLTRTGMPFIMQKLKYRKALVVAMVLACVLIGFLSSMVWSVEILPGKGVCQADLLAAEKILWESGVRPGVFLHTVQNRTVAAAILQQCDNLSWVLVRRQGTKIYVELEGGVENAPELPAETPRDLVAPKDFELVKCTVYQGTPLYKVGDIVHQGQVVVSGLEAGRCASADVEGRTWYTVSVPVPSEIEWVEETGRSQSRYTFFVLGLQIPLSWGKKDFGTNCHSTRQMTYWSLPGGVRLPLGVCTVKVYETCVQSRSVSGEEALEYARMQGMQLLDEKVPDTATVLSTQFKIVQAEDGAQVYQITAECLERINMKIVDKL